MIHWYQSSPGMDLLLEASKGVLPLLLLRLGFFSFSTDTPIDVFTH